MHYLLGFQSLSTVIDQHFVGILDLRLTLMKPFTLIELLHNIIIGEKAKVEPGQEFNHLFSCHFAFFVQWKACYFPIAKHMT